MNRVGKLIWLKNSIPKNAWVYFFLFQPGISTTSFRWHEKQRAKGRGGGLQYRGGHGWKGRTAIRWASVAAEHMQQHDFEPHLVQAHVTSWIPPKGDNSPSVQTQGTCGLEQKKLYYFLSLAQYFWAATVFTLLTGIKPYLLTNPLPAPMDNWLLSINVACGIFCWEVAQLLQNEDPNLLIIQRYWGYVTSLAHTLSHVPAASVPSFCFPDEHMHALTCVCAQTTRCGIREGFLHSDLCSPNSTYRSFLRLKCFWMLTGSWNKTLS